MKKTFDKQKSRKNKIVMESKHFKILGYFLLINGIWFNGFMLGAADRIIDGTSKCEFWNHYIITFALIFCGLKLITSFKKDKEVKKHEK